ncbi:MAG: CBS domain-containing protein [Calditrichaeota bacterium]|mgnify:FL=1|jgi:CBS domain-containing protein|nr:CBS domain-containing protein [Calditrichota bacterium]MBT7617676.1 CBS domain-containing protein [Calditrichota bacterium]MBT7788985.1 CBS domain-containing protein [Calditrichota bacterium]
MTIRELLAQKGSKVFTADSNSGVIDAVKLMTDNKVGCVLVVDKKGLPIGIFTERDVLRMVATDIDSILNQKLTDVMTTDLIIVTPDEEIEVVQNIMTDKHLRHLPILEEGKIAGMVSIGDIVKVNLKHREFEIHHMRDYIMGKI